MQLPEEFIKNTRETMGSERFQRFLESFAVEVPASIRLNPKKSVGLTAMEGAIAVPWCREGYYLPRRPNFTMDPLLHAGCYYVQEASSMFLDTVLRQHLPSRPLMALDLCAAPGGKSTLLRAALPEGSVLYSNEPDRKRVKVLAENIEKWGWEDCILTNLYPKDYRGSKLLFDVILCDVPCSGEGMFRKDEATIREWSVQQVEKCWRLQRDIVSDAWQCLDGGGLMVYSTCTFNTKENEENVRWMLSEFGAAEVLPVAIQPEWNITGSLLPGFDVPVYRFIPGISRGEGLFICALRKAQSPHKERGAKHTTPKSTSKRGHGKPTEEAIVCYKTLPSAEGLGETRTPLSYPQAMAYLRGEALTLPPDTPRGIVTVSYMGHALGTVKNIGTRANNLYPKEWRIKTTHIPTDYEAILRHT